VGRRRRGDGRSVRVEVGERGRVWRRERRGRSKAAVLEVSLSAIPVISLPHSLHLIPLSLFLFLVW
jgi:hypothetical protein